MRSTKTLNRLIFAEVIQNESILISSLEVMETSSSKKKKSEKVFYFPPPTAGGSKQPPFECPVCNLQFKNMRRYLLNGFFSLMASGGVYLVTF